MASKKPAVRTKKKVAKKKLAPRKVKKKAPGRGGGLPDTKSPASTASADAARLGIVVDQTEQAIEKASKQLADARERVERAEETARVKRTGAALAVADRAREEVAMVNKHRLDAVIALNTARDAVGGTHEGNVDWDALEQALKEALDRYQEVLRTHDRRVHRRARERRDR